MSKPQVRLISDQHHCVHVNQWNLSIVDTIGPLKCPD